MSLVLKSFIGLLATAPMAAGGLTNCSKNYLERDVIVVGGGASGAHAAVRLREDLGQSIVLIEKDSVLGGHINTYVDSSSGHAYEFGVQNYLDVNGTADFFARLGVDTKAPGRTSKTTRYIDFTTGQAVNYTGPAGPDQTAALAKYAELCAKYEDMLLPSYWNFPAPEDIPEDLLLPFGEFVKKHSIENVVPTLFQITGLGVGDVTKELTIWVMQAFGGPMARSMLGQQASLVPASGRNQDLYDAIGELLGDDVLYSSTVVKSHRSDEGVVVTVRNANGEHTTIKAKRLLLSMQPTAENLKPLDLDATETGVFSKLAYSNVYAGIVAHPSLPRGFSLTNLPAAAAPHNFTALPQLSFTARFDWMGSEAQDIFRIMIVGDEALDSRRAKDLVQGDFDRIVKAGTVAPANSTKLEYVAFANHGAMHMRVPAEELKAGFIQDLYALQGLRSTWWTGGAWVAQFQTHLWLYNDLLFPKMLKGL